MPLKSGWPKWALLLGAAAVLWRVVRYALGFPLWGDEAFLAVSFFGAHPGALMGKLEYAMVAPPAFLVGVWTASELFGLSEWALRLVPFLGGLLGVGLAWLVLREALGSRRGVLAFALFVASYYPLRHAVELKPYSWDLVWSALLLGAALLWSREPRDRSRAWAFAGLASCSVWGSYPALFTALGACIVLAFEPKARARAVVAALLVVASFLVVYLLVGRHQQWPREVLHDGQWASAFPPRDGILAFCAWLWSQLTGRMLAYPNGGESPRSVATLALSVWGAITLARRGRGTWVWLSLAPLPLMLVAAWLEKYPFGGTARVHQHLAIPICSLAGAGLWSLFALLFKPGRAWLATRVLASLVLASMALGLVRDVASPTKTTSDANCRAIARALGDEIPTEERCYVFGAFERPDGPGDGEPEVPNLTAFEGSAARMRYHMEVSGPGRLLWGSSAAKVAEDTEALTVIAYVDDEWAFPEEAWEAWLAGVEARIVERHWLPFRDDEDGSPEGLHVLRCAPDER